MDRIFLPFRKKGKSINTLWMQVFGPWRFSVRKKLFCPKGATIDISANHGNIISA
jgi:hypothetical protein